MSDAGTGRSFWTRRVRDPLLAQLTQGITPRRLALTLGLGVAGGLFPFLGFTTALCFLLALAFRLNQPVIHVVNQLLWPVQVPMIAVYVQLGAKLYGVPALPFDPALVSRLFFESQREFWTRFGFMGLQAFTAWLLSVPLLVGATYVVCLPLLRRLASAAPART